MMSALVTMLRDTATPVEVSLETYFGCGIGLCTGCTVETAEGNKRACVDGPVMDGRLILWERLMEG
jgi:dihydroorotate dehydrogenase electron transfer subunit